MEDPPDLTTLGVPEYELTRSPAALAVGRLAAASGLGTFHFEHRVRLHLPEAWLPEGRPDLGSEEVQWRSGVLPESKYQAFRHDLLLGSFHPGHRAKWTAHELCHGLVGFAWRAGASSLFNALAARLAEVLPVALWYFLDEAHLRRCADHAGQGPLHQGFCAACELAARGGALLPATDAERWMADGWAFVDRELACIERSKKAGRMLPHRLGSLDLASDGLAYAAAHGDRLGSPEMERFCATFFAEGQGLHADLESLSARVLEVLEALSGEGEAAPLRGDRWRWVTQDLGMRLLGILAETDGECERELDRLVTKLAGSAEAPPDEAVVALVQQGYAALHADYELPPPEDVFGTGYGLPGGAGRSVRQLSEGLATCVPGTWARLGAKRDDLVAEFAAADPRVREPLGRRFAAWLAETSPGALSDLARYEAALCHVAPVDAELLTLRSCPAASEEVRLAPGVELLALHHDVQGLAERALGPGDVLPHRRDEPAHLAICAAADGEVEVAELSAAAAVALEGLAEGPRPASALGLSEAEVEQLVALSVLAPVAWALSRER